MRIEEKIDKYLNEASRKEALEKVKKTIKSSRTDDQLKVASRMVMNFYEMYGNKFIEDLVMSMTLDPMAKTTIGELSKMIEDKKAKIAFQNAMKNNK